MKPRQLTEGEVSENIVGRVHPTVDSGHEAEDIILGALSTTVEVLMAGLSNDRIDCG